MNELQERPPLWDLSDGREIRGLSFWQPFGTLMFHGKVETRAWKTPYRGLVLICTTLKPLDKQPLDKSRHITFSRKDIVDVARVIEFDKQLTGYPPTAHLNGFAIGIGRIKHCRPVWRDDKTFFQHKAVESPLFAHIYEDVVRIEPFPVKGGQGWFKVTPAMRSQIKIL